MSAHEDRARVQRAAVSVGLYVGIASAVVITAGVGVLIAVILLTSRNSEHPSEIGGGTPQDRDGDHLVVDVDQVVPWVIVIGVAGVLILAVIAWFAAARSVRPLGEALRLQRNFVADASHELRTPLTTLTSRIQIAERRNARAEPVAPTLRDLRGDARYMDEILTDMLLVAEGRPDVSAHRTLMSEAIAAAQDSLLPLADEVGVRFATAVSGEGCTTLPPTTARRVMVALLDNAIQHAPVGSTVSVRLERVDAFLEIRVTDEGEGIRGIEPERVFERFARSGESGRRRGFGLGLSLVREIAAAQGGSVVVESTSDAGTTFMLRLPECATH